MSGKQKIKSRSEGLVLKKNGKKTGYGCPPVENQYKEGNPGGPGRPATDGEMNWLD